jgi:hypothetical protein
MDIVACRRKILENMHGIHGQKCEHAWIPLLEAHADTRGDVMSTRNEAS